MDWNWLISPIAGSIIGYGTNYVAIKMLFRPHTPKYIGKFRIPFTPGLIPKEKSVLAKEIGKTVEQHLLGEDVLIETLTSFKAKEAFLRLINTIPSTMEASEYTINEWIYTRLGVDMEQNIGTLTDQFVVETLNALQSKETMDVIIPYIVDGIANLIDKNISNIISHEDTVDTLTQLGTNLAQSETVQDNIKQYLQQVEDKILETNTPLYDTIPPEYIEYIYNIVQENAPYIGESIINAVSEGESAEKIKVAIKKWAEENFNPMVLMFVKVDKIYEGIITLAKTALNDEKISDDFGRFMCQMIEGLLKQPPSFYIKDKDSIPNYKTKLINILQQNINKTNINSIIQTINDELLNSENRQELITSSYIKEHINNWLNLSWDRYINSETIFVLSKQILSQLIQFIGNNPIANLSMLIPSTITEQIGEGLFHYYTQVINSNSKVIAEIMDISKLVESKINEFSSQEAEDIIISVVNNQLKAITWLGALLGFIIGIIPNLIK